MTPQDYLQVLRSRLRGKAPKRLKNRTLGDLVLVLKDEQEQSHGITVRMEKNGVKVLEGASSSQENPITYVFARMTDWLAFYERGEREKLGSLKLFGDTGLLHTMTELWAQRNSVLSLRCGGAL